MARPTLLSDADVDAWLAAHEGWERTSPEAPDAPAAIARSFGLADFSAALGLAVRVGLLAEKRDHHPDIALGWGKARVTWSTHDAGGLTGLDLELAEATDALVGA